MVANSQYPQVAAHLDALNLTLDDIDCTALPERLPDLDRVIAALSDALARLQRVSETHQH